MLDQHLPLSHTPSPFLHMFGIAFDSPSLNSVLLLCAHFFLFCQSLNTLNPNSSLHMNSRHGARLCCLLTLFVLDFDRAEFLCDFKLSVFNSMASGF